MILLKRVFTFSVLIVSLILLAQCRHDPPLVHGSTGPDSTYIGHPYTFVNHSVAGTPGQYREVKVPSDNPETYEGIQLGRMLFYDSTLSLNHRVSCGTCHQQQYSFGDNQKLSQNVHGSTTRNASTLVNLGINSTFFWDGRQATIEDAANDALTHEQSPDFSSTFVYLDTTPGYKALFKKAFGRPQDSTQLITQVKIVKALAQFIRTLRSEDSRFDKYQKGEAGSYLSQSESNGKDIFFDGRRGDCTHCHSDAPYQTFITLATPFKNNALDTVVDVHQFADIGFGKVSGNLYDYGTFKIPTLRNVEVSAPYMHDGRLATLSQVADHYGTRDSLKRSPTIDPVMGRFSDPTIPDLTQQDKDDLVAFLKTLTDTAFLHNPDLSNPFHH